MHRSELHFSSKIIKHSNFPLLNRTTKQMTLPFWRICWIPTFVGTLPLWPISSPTKPDRFQRKGYFPVPLHHLQTSQREKKKTSDQHRNETSASTRNTNHHHKSLLLSSFWEATRTGCSLSFVFSVHFGDIFSLATAWWTVVMMIAGAGVTVTHKGNRKGKRNPPQAQTAPSRQSPAPDQT